MNGDSIGIYHLCQLIQNPGSGPLQLHRADVSDDRNIGSGIPHRGEGILQALFLKSCPLRAHSHGYAKLGCSQS